VIYFFFQAEDGIRDRNVTGVQTCALPILPWRAAGARYSPLKDAIDQDSLTGTSKHPVTRQAHLISPCYGDAEPPQHGLIVFRSVPSPDRHEEPDRLCFVSHSPGLR